MRRLLATLALIGTAAVIAACGSSGSGGGSTSAGGASTSAAAADTASTSGGAVKIGESAPAPTPLSLNIPKKTIGIFCPGCAGETVRRSALALQEAVKLVGWNSKFVDGQFIPTKMQSLMSALVDSKVDAIVGAFMEPGPIAASLQAAHKAGIPVINVGFPSSPSPDLTGQYVADEVAATKLLVDRMKKDLPQGTKVAELDLPQYIGVRTRMAEWRKDSKGYFDVVANHQVADLSKEYEESRAAGVDMLNAHPDLGAFFSCCDFGGQPLSVAAASAGKKIPVYAYYSLPSMYPYIKNGQLVVVEEDNVKASIAAIYQLVQYFASKQPLDPSRALSESPSRAVIIDKSNLPPKGTDVFPFASLWAPYAKKLTAEYGAK
jgi:ABC-type sugar transport system substrate-binding protein